MVGELYSKYYNKLYNYGCIVHNNKSKVEDVIQNFFIWAIEHPQKLKAIENFEAFAFKAIRTNLVQKLIKDDRFRIRHLNYISTFNRATSQPSIETQLTELENMFWQSKNIKKAVEELPHKLKEIVYLRYYANFSYAEIESTLGIANQVARNYNTRAIKRLKASCLCLTLIIMLLI